MCKLRPLLSLVFLLWLHVGMSQTLIKNDPSLHRITIRNRCLHLVVDYDHQCRVALMEVNGENVIDTTTGIYSRIRTLGDTLSTLYLKNSPVAVIKGNVVELTGIAYGDPAAPVFEEWKFVVDPGNISYSVRRHCSKTFRAESVSFPVMEFRDMHTWEGAFQGFGGIAWFYLFNEKLMTYGVHTDNATFWNSKTNNGLKVAVTAPGREVAMKYSRMADGHLFYGITISKQVMVPRYDSGTNRRRFIRKKTDVWSSFLIQPGTTSETIRFTAFNYGKKYDRGEFRGVDGKQVTAVLNTIARMGVIDKNHFGGNSWHTPYGPICLHEQYIAKLGLGIDDPDYLSGYKQCLDFYRDNAIRPDGRVWPRWAYTNEDAMSGQYTSNGFYEAQWGYLMDSNPDYVSNVSDLYNLTGDKTWVKGQQTACEKALDFLLKRDYNGNHLVEMMNDSHREKKSSDWIDIIWASYENAFVNAKLYHALRLWSDIEQQLGNGVKAHYYTGFADLLKQSFNKSVHNGGFWDAEKGYYDYWRDKDQSIHGNNLVTPVNFMAIAYGICDDTARIRSILEKVESEMRKEHLFFWPISMFPYQTDEGKEYQFPFPFYENGDIFLSWGSVAVEAYSRWKPALALQYVKNVLRQDSIDGLAFQRYSRKNQTGQGDDILSGNSLSVVGLYQSIYGFHPLYNRFYLAPRLSGGLYGSRLIYHYRGEALTVQLDSGHYRISDDIFSIGSKESFAFNRKGNSVQYFWRNKPVYTISGTVLPGERLDLEIGEVNRRAMSWHQVTRGKIGQVSYLLHELLPGRQYGIFGDGRLLKKLKSDGSGSISFALSGNVRQIRVGLP